MQLDDKDLFFYAFDEPHPDLAARIERKKWETFTVLSQKLNRPASPCEIVYDLKGRTSGQATRKNGKQIIRLNLQLLNDPRYVDDMIDRTLPHEICHIVQRQFWPASQSHGPEWKRLMRLIGLTPDRCHNYETQRARAPYKKKKYAVYCNCESPHGVTVTIIRRMQQGTEYQCRRCRATLRLRKEV